MNIKSIGNYGILISMLFGFMIAGGNPMTLIHPSELIIVIGMTSCALIGNFGLSFFSFLGDGTMTLFFQKSEPCPLYVKIAEAGSKYAIGSGIIAFILGLVNTFSGIADGPAAVGMRTSAALVGPFYGVLFSVFFFRHLQYIFSENYEEPTGAKRSLGIVIFVTPILLFIWMIVSASYFANYTDLESTEVEGTGIIATSPPT